MKFVADENIDEPAISALRNFQLNILSVGEIMCGCSDSEVLEFANSNNSFLITADKDFGELVFRQRKIVRGVILLRLHGLSIENKITTLKDFFEKHSDVLKQEGVFIVISENNVRVRKSISGI